MDSCEETHRLLRRLVKKTKSQNEEIRLLQARLARLEQPPRPVVQKECTVSFEEVLFNVLFLVSLYFLVRRWLSVAPLLLAHPPNAL